eukprot:CAMPEP_0202067550 /NCGR_PEP_ID=MMETSP0963-20130614/54534_1 /ASSEMBLY_ACC=CAM_ASM_000494 /TAXON_ID=4773 /ORGANISM="Schizochytrium aggregatum, Strain ATCC28209" /LENGTH=359 /DNA_ID=CAMNT_0048634265 /DNA_START=21 /DNA_END=1100 /DNA_ORIENTATION=+
MKILYGAHHGYTKEERERFTTVVYVNIIINVKTVLEHSRTMSPLSDPALRNKIDDFLQISDTKDVKFDKATGDLILQFWNDPGFQETWMRRSEFQVQDALAYFCSEMDRISAPDYVPNPQDILRIRVRTTGIVEESYTIDGVNFVMFDVGGQRNERKKWIHAFDKVTAIIFVAAINDVNFVMFDVGGQRNERKKWIHAFDKVTAIIFVAAINEYDQVLFEDSSMNRMDEAVILFDEICNSPFFEKTSMILFLNKKDLFREKLKVVPFRVDDPQHGRFQDFEYKGPLPPNFPDNASFERYYESVRDYILKLFVNRNKNKKKEIYQHITCATDTQNVEVVFNACKDIILRINLARSGFVPT